ncbi:hypothetical protein CN211_08500 [Sinorhizobium meliloti]|nr:hypothetical protein CN211_08500 [Sinorhizobium meliloti]
MDGERGFPAFPIRFADIGAANRLNLLAPRRAAGQESLRSSSVVHRWKEKKSQLSAAAPPV